MKSAIYAALTLLALTVPSVGEAQTTPTAQAISGTRLELQARGESRVVPDIAIISAGVVTEAPDAATAMRDNAVRMARAMVALKKAGLADKDIQTQSISLSPQYRYVENKPPVITGYQASNQLSIRFRDISKSGDVLDVLVREGINQINGPNLTVDKPEAALDAARLSALKILQARANLYAKATGMTVKRIISISENADYGGGPVPIMLQANMAEAKTSIAPGEQAMGVTVSAVFELQ